MPRAACVRASSCANAASQATVRRRDVAVANMAVVDVKTRGAKAGRARDQLVERDRSGPGAMPVRCIPQSRSTKEIERDARGGRRARQRLDGPCIINQRRKTGRRKFLHELDEPLNVRPNRLIREQHVGHRTRRRHLRFRNRGALVFHDALRHLHPDDLGQLVRLHVRTKTIHTACDPDHPADVLLDAVRDKSAAPATPRRRHWRLCTNRCGSEVSVVGRHRVQCSMFRAQGSGRLNALNGRERTAVNTYA